MHRATVCERLRDARLNKNISLEEIAQESCVSQRYLQAIEAGQFDKLPELTFAVGFVRAFARSVGEDENSVAQDFKDELRRSGGRACASSKSVTMAAPKKRMPAWLSPIAGILGVGATILFFGSTLLPQQAPAPEAEMTAGATENKLLFAAVKSDFAPSLSDSFAAQKLTQEELIRRKSGLEKITVAERAVAFSEGHSESNVDTTPVVLPDTASQSLASDKKGKDEAVIVTVSGVQQRDVAPIGKILDKTILGNKTEGQRSFPTLLPAAQAQAPAVEEAETGRLKVHAYTDTWIRLGRADGSEVWSGIIARGEEYAPLIRQGMTLSLSNAGGVALELDGKPLILGRERGQPVSDVPLQVQG